MSNPKKRFSKIYDKYIEKIYRFVFLKVNSQETAEDLTSKVFLKGWEAFKKSEVKGQKSIENPQAFLYQIARNLVIDFYREKGKTQIISAEYSRIPDPRTNLEEKAILSADLEQVRKSLENLRENYQNVIIWHYLDDLSISEIAEILNKPEGTVRVTLHRALKALKKEISEA
jgi:RNA polymerase sigma-70 factor (ECF subfamily)